MIGISVLHDITIYGLWLWPRGVFRIQMANEELVDELVDGDVVTISRKGWYQGMLRHPERVA